MIVFIVTSSQQFGAESRVISWQNQVFYSGLRSRKREIGRRLWPQARWQRWCTVRGTGNLLIARWGPLSSVVREIRKNIYTPHVLIFGLQIKLPKQVPVRPHFVHTTSIIESLSFFTYIARTIRPTLRTLYSIPSPVLLSSILEVFVTIQWLYRWTHLVRGWFWGINLRSCHGGGVNTTLSAA